MAFPPYLMTTVAPRSSSARAAPRPGGRLGHSAARRRGWSAWWPSVSADGRSCRVRRVLVRRSPGSSRWSTTWPRRRPGVQVDDHRDLARGQVHQVRGPRRRPRVPAHLHTVDATSSATGRRRPSVVPTADSTRPQLGSLPNMAHLNRLLRATARAALTASASVAAPTTLTSMSLAGTFGVRRPVAGPGLRTPPSSPAAKTSSAAHATGSAGHEHHRVVRGHAAVGVHAVEGLAAAAREAPRRASRRRRLRPS